MSTFKKLTEQRGKQNISQREMAKYLKITPSTLNRYEKHNRKITAKMQDEYAERLGIELKLQIK
jgi:transcriptional regulator with XRE-family HTH domain